MMLSAKVQVCKCPHGGDTVAKSVKSYTTELQTEFHPMFSRNTQIFNTDL
jgi:hypothetical protein